MKTVRVRIAVAVTSDGFWAAEGWAVSGGVNARDRVMLRLAKKNFAHFEDRNVQVSFIEADVPIPEPQTIEGVVK